MIGGLSRWETRLAGLREEFHRRHAAEEDAEARERLALRIAAVENLTRLALPAITRLAALPVRALWGEWIAALTELAEFALREPESVIQLLEELEPMSEIGPVLSYRVESADAGIAASAPVSPRTRVASIDDFFMTFPSFHRHQTPRGSLGADTLRHRMGILPVSYAPLRPNCVNFAGNSTPQLCY